MTENLYQAAFFIVPARILNLPDLTISFLRVYETVFQFWNHGKECFLSNKLIMERTGIKSESTIKDAFVYFEKHNELIRVTGKAGKRFLAQPSLLVPTDDGLPPVDKPCLKSDRGADAAAGGGRRSGGGGAATAAHNNKNLNKELKRGKSGAAPVEKLSLSDFKNKSLEYTEEELEIAKELGISNIKLVFDKYKAWLEMKGRKNFTHTEFKLWLLREREQLQKEQTSNLKREKRPQPKFWGEGHPSYTGSR